MKNYINKFSDFFPVYKTWLSLHAFLGWLSLSSGIILANKFSLTRLPTLYNNYTPIAILFFLFIALINKNLTVRLLFFFVTGFSLLSFQAKNEHFFLSELDKFTDPDNNIFVSGKLSSPPVRSHGKYTFLLSADKFFSLNDTLKMNGKILKCYSTIPPSSYGSITCSGHFKTPRYPDNPHAYNEHAYLISNRIWGKFTIDTLINTSTSTSLFSTITQSVRKTVLKTISHVNNINVRGILQAAFLGEKNSLTNHTKSTFRDAGIYHLLAISGLHVAILISSMWLVLLKIPISRSAKIIITILFIWCYLFFIGLIPSLFRAVIMATLVLLSFIFQRNSHVLNSLGIAGIVWLIISPTSLFTPGFQLSFAATFGIITLVPVFSNLFMPSLANPVIQFIVKVPITSFYVSLSGFIATVPVLIYYFGRISIYGLFANILAVILMGCAMNTFFIGIFMQLVWEPFSVIFMRITEFLLAFLIKIAEFSGFFSFSSIKVPVVFPEFFYIYILFFLGLILVNKKLRINYFYRAASFLFLLVPAILFIHSLNSQTEITFFSTKKGSLTGIKFSNNNIWLVGSAPHESYSNPFRNAVGPWLRHRMIKNFDAILLPSLPQNIIHDLGPILTEYKPNTIISCRKPGDEILQESFQSFINNYHVDHLEAYNGWRFIPALHCTCAIYIEECENRWYEECGPAIVEFSIGNIKMLFYETEGVSIHKNTKYDIIKTKDSIYINSLISPDKNRNNRNSNFTSYSVESDGAVTIISDNKRIKKVSTMSRLF